MMARGKDLKNFKNKSLPLIFFFLKFCFILKCSLCFSLQRCSSVIHLIADDRWINGLWVHWVHQSCFYFQKIGLHLISTHSKKTNKLNTVAVVGAQDEGRCYFIYWCSVSCRNGKFFPLSGPCDVSIYIHTRTNTHTHSHEKRLLCIDLKTRERPMTRPPCSCERVDRTARRAAPRPPQRLWKIYDPLLTSTSCKHRR